MFEDDDDPGAKMIWTLLECPGQRITASESITRFTTKGRVGTEKYGLRKGARL